MTVIPRDAFPAYLVIVGLLAVVVYALAGCLVQDRMLIRYTLLALFIPIGVTAALLRREGAAIARGIATFAVLAWAAASGVDDGRVLAEYVRHAPRNEYRELADFLEREGIRYGEAPYWTAYQIDFLTRERVTLGSYDTVRIDEYEDRVRAHLDESAAVSVDVLCTNRDDVRFERWCLPYMDRVRRPTIGR